MKTLELALTGRDYLVGGKFSAADVYLGSQLAWGMQFGTIERRKAFLPYVRRITSRAAAVRAKEIDDALLRAHGGNAV